MPDLSRSEAVRLLAGLERRRQTAIDAGDIGEMEHAETQMARIRDGFGAAGVDLPAVIPQPDRLPTHNRDRPPKSNVVAGVLGILLGGLGLHKFYLGKTGQGLLYLLFCWAVIPSLVGLIEGVVYLTQDPEEFALRHS